MERTASTDERLDLVAEKVDAGFERLDRDIRELRGIFFRFGRGIMIGLVGVIIALLGVTGAVIGTS
jgi:hypothetical protein